MKDNREIIVSLIKGAETVGHPYEKQKIKLDLNVQHDEIC
jgi:hypothetical protein